MEWIGTGFVLTIGTVRLVLMSSSAPEDSFPCRGRAMRASYNARRYRTRLKYQGLLYPRGYEWLV